MDAHKEANETQREKDRLELYKNATSCSEQTLNATSHKIAAA